MNNHNNDALFQQLIRGLDSKMQAQLNYMFAHGQAMNEYNRRQEREQLKREITAEVLSNISASVDVSSILKGIKELKKELDELYGMFD